MRKKLFVFILIVCMSSVILSGCMSTGIVLHGGNSGNAFYLTEVETDGYYAYSITAEMNGEVKALVDKEGFATVFAQAARNELFAAATGETYPDIVFDGKGEYSITSPSKAWVFSAVRGDSLYGYYVDATVSVKGTRADYNEYLAAIGGGAFGTDSFFNHRDEEHFARVSRGLYNVELFNVPYPIEAWFADFAEGYSGTGVLAPLWTTQVDNTDLSDKMSPSAFSLWKEDLVLSYLHGTDIFNGCDGYRQKLVGGMSVLEWSAQLKDGASAYQDGIELNYRSQKVWAFALIGFFATAAFAGLMFLVFKYIKKKPKPEAPFDPYGGRKPIARENPFGSDYIVPPAQVEEDPFGKDYENKN